MVGASRSAMTPFGRWAITRASGRAIGEQSLIGIQAVVLNGQRSETIVWLGYVLFEVQAQGLDERRVALPVRRDRLRHLRRGAGHHPEPELAELLLHLRAAARRRERGGERLDTSRRLPCFTDAPIQVSPVAAG